MGTSRGRSTSTDSILEFLKRQSAPGPAMAANATPADAWSRAMSFQNGPNDPSGGIKGREQIFLANAIISMGGTPEKGASLANLWEQYLTLKGYAGSLDDKFAQWIDHGTF